MNTLIFNKSNLTHTLQILKEKPYCMFCQFVTQNISNDKFSKIGFKIEGKSINNSSLNQNIYWSKYELTPGYLNSIDVFWEIGYEYLIFDSIVITCLYPINEDEQIELKYKTENLNIPILNPFQLFSNHISELDNTKIFFSAPFGHGKTTFLDLFFEEETNAIYSSFKIFPVNYSIANNEDIFKYIKAEILFQLIERVCIDDLSLSVSEKLYVNINGYVNNFIRNFAQKLSIIDKKIEDIMLLSDFFEWLEKQQPESKKIENYDLDKSKKYLDELIINEGSLFEDNFYTLLIRQLLQKNKVQNKKYNVLIIEDLDRIDPEHIFRILNVFAAHFDNKKYIDLNDKFGFDKIILVADYKNIQKIYSHKFGKGVDFDGYFSKYYSKTIFFYDNQKTIAKELDSIIQQIPVKDFSVFGNMLRQILEDMIQTKCLNIRTLHKISRHNLNTFIFNSKNEDFISKIISFFVYQFTANELIEKLNQCINVEVLNKSDYNLYTEICFAHFAKNYLNKSRGNEYEFSFEGHLYKFKILQSSSGGVFYSTTLISDSNPQKEKFNANDFYTILQKIIEKKYLL